VTALTQPAARVDRPVVYIIEDDASLANALSLMLGSVGFEYQAFGSGEAFMSSECLQHAASKKALLEPRPTVILLDIRLKTMSGIEVFYELRKRSLTARWPVIFLTGHGDMETAIRVLREGAYDFLTKPFDSESLIEKISQAGAESENTIASMLFLRDFDLLLLELTDKEREVMTRIVRGETNKEIADELGNSSRTVEIHRAKIFDKLKVANAVELSRLVERYRLLGGKTLDS
jgi:two-component system response regulator DctR